VLAALLLFVGCASQAPPSGGPRDRTPPRIISTIPSNDSVAVGTDAIIEVLFSEPMDRQSVERVVFLSPRPVEDPEYGWKGRRLRIRLEGGLVADRTYRVSIGADCRDEYRNKMLGSYDFTFSTGLTISKGVVSGQLEGAVSRTVFVVAFDLAETTDPDPTARAPYVTQAGDDGLFRFPGLGVGRYRFFAFADADQDQTFDLGTEWLAIASEDTHLSEVGATTSLPVMRLVSRDTVAPSPVTARTIDSRRIRMKMSEPVRLPFRVTAVGRDSLPVRLAHHDGSDSSVVLLVTGTQLEGQEYAVTVSGLSDASGNVSSQDTTLIVKGDGRADTRPPSIVATDPGPGGQIQSHSAFVLTFDEAMKPDLPDAFWVRSDSIQDPSGTASWLAPNVWKFTPTDSWRDGDVTVRLDGNAFRDLSGNVLSANADFSFVSIGPDALGTLTGNVETESDPLRIEAVGLETGGRLSVRVAPGDSAFVLKTLMPGKYALSGFVDANDDGVWFPGTIKPFAHPEPLLSQVDTVEVRSRWDTVVETWFSRGPSRALTAPPTRDKGETAP
jgi:uncharacterized protein (DUF2141 family)